MFTWLMCHSKQSGKGCTRVRILINRPCNNDTHTAMPPRNSRRKPIQQIIGVNHTKHSQQTKARDPRRTLQQSQTHNNDNTTVRNLNDDTHKNDSTKLMMRAHRATYQCQTHKTHVWQTNTVILRGRSIGRTNTVTTAQQYGLAS